MSSGRDTLFIELDKRPGHGVLALSALYRLFRELRPRSSTRATSRRSRPCPGVVAGVPVRIHGEHGRDVGDLDGRSRKYQLVRRAYAPFVTHYVALSRDLEQLPA